MGKQNLKNFGKKVKEYRLKNNLTQLELAELLGLSTNFVGMVERGERNTTVDNVFKIAKALKISPANLFV